MKKCMLVTLVIALSIALSSTWGVAQVQKVSDRVNTSTLASLLVWPKIDTRPGTQTLVSIFNAGDSYVTSNATGSTRKTW